MLKVKQAILVVIPPLLTVLMLTYAYFRHKNSVPDPLTPPTTEESAWIEERFTPLEKEAAPFQKLPEATAEPADEAFEKSLVTEIAEASLTLKQAEGRIVELAGPLSKSPLWQQILGQSSPLRRFVAALDAVALGKRPLEPLDFLRPENPFTATKQGQRWLQSDASRERFTDPVQLFCDMPASALAKLYRFLEPALQEACNGLGYRDKAVRDLLTEAFTVLLSTPIPEEEPALVAGVKAGIYYWQHPELEALNDAQKLLLRLGGKNTALLRRQLEAIANELQLYQQP
jgi:hypothetical protein